MSRRIWTVIQFTFFVPSLPLSVTGWILEDWYCRTRPRIANYQGGRIYPLTCHGVSVWLNATENKLFNGLMLAGLLCFLFAFAIEEIVMKRWYKNPMSGADTI
jgi:hypothetical protein